MSKHTPGPWEVKNGSDIFTGLGAKNAEGTEAPSNDGWMIADCDMGSLSYYEVVANARLIAQAPRLLEALKRVTEQYSALMKDCGLSSADTIIEARAAIAAATEGDSHE